MPVPRAVASSLAEVLTAVGGLKACLESAFEEEAHEAQSSIKRLRQQLDDQTKRLRRVEDESERLRDDAERAKGDVRKVEMKPADRLHDKSWGHERSQQGRGDSGRSWSDTWDSDKDRTRHASDSRTQHGQEANRSWSGSWEPIKHGSREQPSYDRRSRSPLDRPTKVNSRDDRRPPMARLSNTPHNRSRSKGRAILERAASQSRSRSASLNLNVSMPHNLGENPTGEVVEAEVLERAAARAGSSEIIWQAKITMLQGGQNVGGRQRTIDISAPPRKSKEHAESDARQLTDMSPQGAKAVRSLANALHKDIHHGKEIAA